MDKHSYIIRCCMVLLGLLVVSCSSIDCPLNNRVYVIYKLQGDETPLSDSLTISTNRINRNDTVLLNHVVNTDSFQIPISYQRPEDVLYFRRSNNTGLNIIDTVIIKKEDVPHFESIDCSPNFFHTIKSVQHTRLGIDSIIINKANVTYDTSKPHLFIYFKHLYQ